MMTLRLFAALLLGTSALSPAWAQYQGNIPPGSVLGNPQTTAKPAAPSSMGAMGIATSVAGNGALKSASTATMSAVVRRSFATAGDAPAVTYYASASPCSLNAGAGDDGSQVASADGRCWLAQPSGDLDARTWGKTYPLAMYVDKTAGNDNGGANYCLDTAHKCATLTQAVTQLLRFNVRGQQPVINLGPGTFAGQISINSPLRGAAENDFNSWSNGSAGAIKLVGAGSASTLLQSPLDTDQCYTLLANYGGALALSGIAVTYNGPCVGGAPLYAQADGKITIGADVVLGGTSTNAIVGEERGFIWVQPGIGGTGSLKIDGTFTNGIALGTQSMFQADALVTMNGTYSQARFLLDDQSDLKLSHNPPLDGSLNGQAFVCNGNSTIITYQPGGLGGTPGLAGTGCVWQGAGVPATTIASSTGTGLGGTTQAYWAGADPYHGGYVITAGSSAASTGTISLNWPYALGGPCAVGPQSSWHDGASFFISYPGPLWQPTISWENGGIPLVSGNNYFLNYICR